MASVAIIGLGNPGARYSGTRHNLGFMVVEELCARQRVALRPGRGAYYVASFQEHDAPTTTYVVMPTTFMNKSGEAAADVLERFSIAPANMLVVVDDFWLPLGRLRFRRNGSDGGHNGLASIIWSLQTDQFPRLRLGIGKDVMPPKPEMADFVLSTFDPDERENVRDMVLRATDAVEQFIARCSAAPVPPPLSNSEEGENSGF